MKYIVAEIGIENSLSISLTKTLVRLNESLSMTFVNISRAV